MSTPVTNFGKVTVSTGYDASATSIVLTTGHGSRLPSTFPYPLTWWNFTDYPDPADDPNREIVTVTNRSGDTLTVTRNAESTGASTKNTGGKTYKMLLGITKAMWDSIFSNALSQTFRGLRVQTHHDADLAPSRVVFSADAIVMSDGEEVSDWDNIVVNLAASGAGGLDTGTEQASTWYPIYAIYNGTTKWGCFHRAKDFLLDEDITAGEDASQGIRSAVDNSTVKVSQGFQLGTAGPVPFIDVKLLKTGTPTGYLWFTIEGNSGGVPNNTPVATSVKLDVSRLTTTATQVRVPFPTPASISAATQYHIVAQGDWAVSATNYVSWRMDGSAATYANGSKALYDSDTGTWTADTDDDLWLRVYVTENDVDFSTTVPSGYRYAHIGWAYNNGSSNLVRFSQLDHLWTLDLIATDGLLINELSGATTLLDLRASIPPLDLCAIILGLTGTGSAVDYAVLGPITAIDLDSTGMSNAALTLTVAYTAELLYSAFDELLVNHSALMVDGGPGSDLYYRGFIW
jgi:hypothetical protein